jgi:hydrogenase 3 maturation protease
MMGDDGAGVLLAQRLREAPLAEWEVLNGGSMPENVLYLVRELSPRRVLVVDASDMDLAPGSVRLIPAARLDDPFLLTTHALPLTYLIEALREFIPQVELLGIQPEIVAFGFPMSGAVRAAVEAVYQDLKAGRAWSLLEV